MRPTIEQGIQCQLSAHFGRKRPIADSTAIGQTVGMKFIADGPDIPEELLVARDRGKVIFFCGAGVSQQFAHLPSFEGLDGDVIGLLGAAQDSPARLLFDKAIEMGRMADVGGLVATDRIFGRPEREFEVRDVQEAVADAVTHEHGDPLEFQLGTSGRHGHRKHHDSGHQQSTVHGLDPQPHSNTAAYSIHRW